MRNKNSKTIARQKGFTFLEVIIGIFIFTILAAGVLGSVAALTRSVKAAREKTELSSLVSADLEIVRNLPYELVGTTNGNPSGSLSDQTNPRIITIESRTYTIYYEVTYFDDPADGLAPADTAAADYKQVKMFIHSSSSGATTTILTSVVPKGLEGTSNAGALRLAVINAQGQPVPGASIHISNTALVPNVILDRVADSGGNWTEVGLPASVNGYAITVSKTGYSSDQTYPVTVQNPNPTKPDATVLVGQVTQVTFAIDAVSSLTVKTLNQQCQNTNGVGVNVLGAKIIGTNPTVYKFNQNFSSSGGQISMPNLEWDTFTPALLAAQGLMVYGTSPIQQIDVLPGTNQTFTLIVGPQSANTLLVIVKDAATGVALEGVQVHLQRSGSPAQDYYSYTGGSVWSQVDWTGGAGQSDFTNVTQYYSDNGNIDNHGSPTGIQLKRTSGSYPVLPAQGVLESSIFDTGTNSTNFTTLTWLPTSQDSATNLKIQIASNNDGVTWNYVGPDGTAGTYYTTPGSNINSVHDGTRYIRYKAYLSTSDSSKTSSLTGITLNYVSGCFSPGQSIFTNLTSGVSHSLDVSLSGYQTETQTITNISGNQMLQVLLSH